MTHATMKHQGPHPRTLAESDGLIGPLLIAAVRAFQRLRADPRPEGASDKATREAAAVRALAYRYLESDRGFAADLYAAADRHEEAARAQRPGSAADRR